MIETLSILPIEFWVAIALFAFGCFFAFQNFANGTGLPMLAVLGTVFFWYVGDVLYNDYEQVHVSNFDSQIMASAWLQVAIFLFSFILFVGIVAPALNRDCSHLGSRFYGFFLNGVDDAHTQSAINKFCIICIAIWTGLVLMALVTLGGDAIYFALSFLGQKVYPFARARVGGGFSAVFSLASNFHVLVGSGFGIIAALSNNPRIRIVGIVGCIFVWPDFLFDRTRNAILAVCAPGIFSWIFLRLRSPLPIKILVLCLAIFAADGWLRMVMNARNDGRTVSDFFADSIHDSASIAETKHLGLNMYEELCWLNLLTEQQQYKPTAGYRYFAEIVNPIPRALWPNKPLIGIEYAIARGQHWADAEGAQAGVGATISTGMIGQGIDNFGPIFGPIAPAFLMALWVTTLARVDIFATRFGRLPLFAIGLVLTFNMGRDITLLVLYPFVFGFVIIKLLEYQQMANQNFSRRQVRQS